jgi:hypothetical protein
MRCKIDCCVSITYARVRPGDHLILCSRARTHTMSDDGDGAGTGVTVYTMRQAAKARFTLSRWRIAAWTGCSVQIDKVGAIGVDGDAHDRLGLPVRAQTLLDDRPMQFTLSMRVGSETHTCVFHQGSDPWEEPAMRPIVRDEIQPHVVVRLNPLDRRAAAAGAELTIPSNRAVYGDRLERMLIFQDFDAHAIRTYDSMSRTSRTSLTGITDRMLVVFHDLVEYLEDAATHGRLGDPSVVYLHCLRGKERSRYGFLFLHALFALNAAPEHACERYERPARTVLNEVTAGTVLAILVRWAASLASSTPHGGGVRTWLNDPHPVMYNALVASLAIATAAGLDEGTLVSELSPYEGAPRRRTRHVRDLTRDAIALLLAAEHPVTCIHASSGVRAEVLCLACGKAAFCSIACSRDSGHFSSCVIACPDSAEAYDTD